MAGDLEAFDMSSGGERAHLRVSDADRHQVAEFLREAAGDGRIDMAELDERLGQAYAAKVYADLVPIVADLPGSTPVAAQSGVARPAGEASQRHYESSIAIFSGQDRKGVWEIAPHHTAVAVMGGVQLDLRQVVFTAPETIINAHAVMGGVDITVNARTRVLVDGIGIMGGFAQGRDRVPAELGPDSPVLRIRGLALMGGVNVVRKQMPGERRPRRAQLPPR